MIKTITIFLYLVLDHVARAYLYLGINTGEKVRYVLGIVQGQDHDSLRVVQGQYHDLIAHLAFLHF